MNRKVTKIIIILVVLAAIIAACIGVYFYFNQGTVEGRIQYGTRYHLTSIRPTERFAGATLSHDSYFCINTGKNEGHTGQLYLKGLNATDAPIPLIITNYKEGSKQTIIEFEYILDNGEDTKIQHLTAISTKNEIRIKAVESHNVNVIQQKYNDIKSLEYEVTILVFSLDQEEA